MTRAGDLGIRDDSVAVGRFNFSLNGRVAIQRQVCSRVVAVLDGRACRIARQPPNHSPDDSENAQFTLRSTSGSAG